MMTDNTLKNPFNDPPGTVVTGKWHKNRYRLLKRLGAGANGAVYLAESAAGPVALKVGVSTAQVASESSVLKTISKARGQSLGPSFLEADDWERGREIIPFYVMEYIDGPDLLSFVTGKGFSWAAVPLIQLLSDLQHLHEQGWIFGDLKPENLLVGTPGNRIRCIDPGGMTKIGRSVKEFTEFFDRGYWGLGSRKAEPSYDLFSVAMVMINLAYPNRFLKKQANGFPQLMAAVRQHAGLCKFEAVLRKALGGGYRTAFEMRQDMLMLLTSHREKKKAKTTHRPEKSKLGQSRAKRRRFRKFKKFMAAMMIILMISVLYWYYTYGQISIPF